MVAYDNRGYLHPFWNGNIYLYGVGELPRTVGHTYPLLLVISRIHIQFLYR